MSIKSKIAQLSPEASKLIATKSKVIVADLDRQIADGEKDSVKLLTYTTTADFAGLSKTIKLKAKDVEDIFAESKSIENVRAHFAKKKYSVEITVSSSLVARFSVKRIGKKKSA